VEHRLTLDTGANVLRLRGPDGERCYRPTTGSAYDLFSKLKEVASTAPGEVVGQLEDYCELMDLGPSAGLVPDRPTTEASGSGDPGWYVVRLSDDKAADGPHETLAQARKSAERTTWYDHRKYSFEYGDQDDDGGFFELPIPATESGDAGTTTADMPGLIPAVLPGGKPLKGMKQPFSLGKTDRSKGGIFKLEADGSMLDSQVEQHVALALSFMEMNNREKRAYDMGVAHGKAGKSIDPAKSFDSQGIAAYKKGLRMGEHEREADDWKSDQAARLANGDVRRAVRGY
jgi:hypothetical protein